MAIHITNLYGIAGTAALAQQNVTKIARELGFIEMGLYHYPVECDTKGELRKRLDGITSAVHAGDLVIVQSPTWNALSYEKALLDVLRTRQDVQIAIFIHDVITMMFEGAPEENYAYLIEIYNMADLVIVPTERMLDFLQKKGLTVKKILVQSMWDLPFSGELRVPEFRRELFFPGSPKKFGFTLSWNYSVPLHLFTNEDYDLHGKNVRLHGQKNTAELLMEFTRGGLGILWEQTAPASYYRYHQPYKLAAFMAAGIPVIAEKGLSHEQIILEYGLGFVVNTIKEAVEIAENITEENYEQLVNNIKNISFLVRGGFFTKKLLIDTVNYLMLG